MARNTEYKKLMLTGGGTGGHLFPAIAAAEAFCKEYPNTEVLFVGTKRKMDAQALKNYQFQSTTIYCYGLKGKNIIELIKALIILPISCLQSLWKVLCFKPDVVIGVGGYVTGPVVAMAKLLGIPTLIHEQNSVPGLANRKLGKFVDKVCVSLPQSSKYFPKDKVEFTGNPIRKNIAALAQEKKTQKVELISKEGASIEEPTQICVLVLGGSLGATALNQLVVDAFTGEYREQLAHIKLIHQTGSRDAQWVATEYQTAGRAVRSQAFFTDMVDVYREADFLVSRAGATTLAEIAVLGKPSIFVPFPAAADNHQVTNAEYYVKGGGARMFEEATFTSSQLAENVLELANNPEKLQEMSLAQKNLGEIDAASKIVSICKKLILAKQNK